MADNAPRVLGLKQLLGLKKPLRERPAPLVFFTDAEFKRAIRGAIELKRRPAERPLVAFTPWEGGLVQDKCESPEGQICFGQWIPAGQGRDAGIYFGCRCRGTSTPPPPPLRCQLVLDPNGGFKCTGQCSPASQTCQLAFWRDPATGRYVLTCRCTLPRLVPA